jgi:NADH:ubiquinone oxidoreductase subunit 3 (subunit A)
MEKILLSPPIAFVILLGISLLFSFFSKFIAAKGITSAGKEKSYACGEDVEVHKVQPDYGQFFSFAFFFTIMHVVALIVATVPKEISIMPFIYILVAVMALFILFRK